MNKKNFLILAKFLFKLPNDCKYFDMRDYAKPVLPGENEYYGMRDHAEELKLCEINYYLENRDKKICCCPIGFAPFAGLEILNDSETWVEYQARIFDIDILSREYFWCFGCGWGLYDNTPHGAAARIIYMLKNGVPEEFFSTGYGTYEKMPENIYKFYADEKNHQKYFDEII